MHKIMGWVEEITVCDCCGKSDLSGTFAVKTEDGSIIHYGSVCVKRNTGIKNPKKAADDYLYERRIKAVQELRKADAWFDYEAKLARGHALGITSGLPFKEFCAAESTALDVKKAEIAAHFNLKSCQIF